MKEGEGKRGGMAWVLIFGGLGSGKRDGFGQSERGKLSANKPATHQEYVLSLTASLSSFLPCFSCNYCLSLFFR